MTTDLDDLIGSNSGTGKKRKSEYPRKDHGELHQLIGRALPYLCGAGGVANLHTLAAQLQITYAACHKWMRPGQKHKIPAQRVAQICKLSADFAESGKAAKNFKPVTKIDFLPFMF